MSTRQEFIKEFEEDCKRYSARLQRDESESLDYFVKNFKEWDCPTPYINIKGFYLSRAAEELTRIQDELSWGLLDEFIEKYSPKTIH